MTIYYNVHYKDRAGRYVESLGTEGQGIIRRYASWKSFRRYAMQGLVEMLRKNPRFCNEADPILYLYASPGTAVHQSLFLCPKNIITEVKA